MEANMKISGKWVAILATHGFEQSELEIPRDKLRAVGGLQGRSRPGCRDLAQAGRPRSVLGENH